MMFELTIKGVKPEPAGSKRAFAMPGKGGKYRAIVTDANAKSRPWKTHVSVMAQEALPKEFQVLEGGLFCAIRFKVPRPAGHFNGKGELNKAGRDKMHPTSKPDVLKLARGVEDALTGIVWRDDAQIVDERITKLWSDDGSYETRIVVTRA
jgi:Holliday junction resolvase RusA-like endonuclease